MKNYLLIILFLNVFLTFGQVVSGNLIKHINQDIQLIGYRGLETIELGSDRINLKGEFEISVIQAYSGMAYLETSDKSSLFLVLNEKEIIVKGGHLTEIDGLNFEKSKENLNFSEFYKKHIRIEKALFGWNHLAELYQNDPLFSLRTEELDLIKSEVIRLKWEETNFIESLEQSSYLKWFIPHRKLLENVANSVKQPYKISNCISEYRKLDFKNTKLYNSGIIDDLIESHYWLMENSGLSMDSIYIQMNISTDYLLENVNEQLYSEVVDYLFNYLEKHSLFDASEHLALKVLSENVCTIDDNLNAQLEYYRSMKIGAIAPDINLNGIQVNKGVVFSNGLKLSQLTAEKTLLIFGSSRCPECKRLVEEIKNHYSELIKHGVQIIFVSLDTDKESFFAFSETLPWLSSCSLLGWETQGAKDYHIFATPTMILLNNQREILLRPNGYKHLESWLNL